MEFEKLIKFEFDRKGLKTVQQMADFSGINTEYLRQTLHGKRVPSDDVIVEACQKMQLSPDKTKELLIAAAKDRAKEPITKDAWSHILNTPANAAPLTMSERPDNAVIIPPETQSIPIYTIIRAGNGEMGITDADQDDDQRIFISDEYAKSKVFAIRIAGDSMMPEVYDGEIGLFKPINGDQIRDRDIYAVEVEGWSAWVIKFVRQDPSGVIQLISANSSYPVKEINPQIARVTLRGKLVESRRIRK